MDLYDILGLQQAATLGEIKRAYRRLARKYHPDINPGDGTAEVRFRQIARAYETLSDPDRRRQYDASGGLEESATTTVSYGFAGFDFSATVTGDEAPTFGDLFAEAFGRWEGDRSVEATRGIDLHGAVALSFEEAMRGVERGVTVTRRDTCRACGGSGAPRALDSPCGACGGTGVLRSTRGHMVFAKPCPQCGGAGRATNRSCRECAGQGLQTRTEHLQVRIPAGVAEGGRIRVQGKGSASAPGGPPGDLIIATQVAPHPLFRREGDDLHLVVSVAVHEAALGSRIDVQAIDGFVRLRVPPGTQSGQRFRLRERGAPSPRSGRRGDLVIEVKLVLPRVLDERSRELLREFGRLNAESVRERPAGGE